MNLNMTIAALLSWDAVAHTILTFMWEDVHNHDSFVYGKVREAGREILWKNTVSGCQTWFRGNIFPLNQRREENENDLEVVKNLSNIT